LDRYHLVFDYAAVMMLLAGQFENHLWRIILIVIGSTVYLKVLQGSWAPHAPIYVIPLVNALVWKMPLIRSRQSRKGWVFVTGGDSGMGKETALHLAQKGYDGVFAGCFNLAVATKDFLDACKERNIDASRIIPITLDVTSEDSVKGAAETVKSTLRNKEGPYNHLLALVNFHGVAYNGPAEYMPCDFYTKQLDVNFVGNIRMVQAFLPMIKEGVAAVRALGGKDACRRGRVVFTGTGGGACSPCPSLLSAYMSSKFACEAFCQSLRMELYMMNHPIDCCMINPGFVKPTMLIEVGQRLAEQMWSRCKEKLNSDVARVEYGEMFDHFNRYSALQPGTHVSKVAEAADRALTAHRPWTSYKVGPDSKAAPIVGMLPTGIREWVARHGMYGVLSPAGKVKGYTV
jgi:NAD(P)-dependent dehydrogenase (short-subunit alcohol dehydrogenase family)